MSEGPGAMIRNLINEREQTQLEVISEIGSKWGSGQTFNGPVLTIPYYTFIEQGGKTYREMRFAYFLPDVLVIDADVEPEVRYRGIYKTVVYRSTLKVRGSFLPPDPEKLKIEKENILFQDAFLQIGIPDMRGIQESPSLQWNSKLYEQYFQRQYF